jgi:ATP-binding cassette, subfamily C (CFTR/MRP), member 1
MKYREDLDPVLHNLDFTMRPGEKTAICGRTGSGKSSMMMALFRLVELCEGVILIDGVDISTIGLHRLRTSMAMIPQDPILFQGTIRNNLDPFDHYPDTEIWNSLERVQLRDHVQSLPNALDGEVAENGGRFSVFCCWIGCCILFFFVLFFRISLFFFNSLSLSLENFSVGQRQLFCMARALLRSSKIVVLDEATANIDVETDRIIQETIREECKDATVLTIAHRVGTITDYDRVLVLSAGEVVEFDAPDVLLANPESAFASMHKESGTAAAVALSTEESSCSPSTLLEF